MPRRDASNGRPATDARPTVDAAPVRGPWSVAARVPDGDGDARRQGPPRHVATPRAALVAARTAADAPVRLAALGGPLADADPFEALAYACGVRGPVGALAVRRSGLEADGVPVPVVDDADLRREVTVLGEQILWLGTYGAVAHDARLRPYRDVGLPPSDARRPWPIGPVREAPTTMAHLRRLGVLVVGAGGFRRVLPGAVAYRVGGRNVLGAWFAARPDPAPGSPWPAGRAADLEALLLVLNRLAALEDRRLELAAAVAAAAGRPPEPGSGRGAWTAPGHRSAPANAALADLVRGDRPAGQSL